MAVLNTPRLNLPYPDGNDLLRDGDNRIHDLASALDTIVATVDELEAIELTPGPPGPAGGSTDIFRFRAKVPATTGDPGPGFIRWNTVPQISATELAIDVRDQDNLDVVLGLAAIDAGNRIYMQEYSSGAEFQNWEVTGPGTQVGSAATGYWTFPVTLIASGGTGTSGFINGLMLAMRVTRPGTPGPPGPAGAAMVWRGAWNSATAYAANDLVYRSGSAYSCVTAHTNFDPVAAGAFTMNTSQDLIGTGFGTSAGDWTIANRFTPTATVTVNAIRLNRVTALAPVATVGIASDKGTKPSLTAWLSKNDAANLNATGWNTVTIPSVTLTAGTTYYVVVQSTTSESRNFYCSGGLTASGTNAHSFARWSIAGDATYDPTVDTSYVLGFQLGTTTANPWQVFLRGVLPPGGTTGQYLKKLSATDYDVGWVT